MHGLSSRFSTGEGGGGRERTELEKESERSSDADSPPEQFPGNATVPPAKGGKEREGLISDGWLGGGVGGVLYFIYIKKILLSGVRGGNIPEGNFPSQVMCENPRLGKRGKVFLSILESKRKKKISTSNPGESIK